MLLIDSQLHWHAGFAALGEVVLHASGESVHRHPDLARAEALVVRSMTPVGEALLSAAPALRFVASATAGLDHLDLDACRARGIRVFSAAGHNAPAVADWVWWAMHRAAESREWSLEGRRLGVLGCGHTGEAVAERAAAHGMQVVRSDPPRHEAGTLASHVALDEALQCDVVTVHVPLIRPGEGEHPTEGLLSAERVRELDGIVINASRGEVLTAAALENPRGPTFALDVHRSEPTPDPATLPRIAVATPHVAGSTHEAKWEASASLVRQLAAALHVEPPAPPVVPGSGQEVRCPSLERGVQPAILEVLEEVTRLSRVEREFRNGPHSASSFLELRRNSLRRALQGVRIRGVGEANVPMDFTRGLKAHGLVFND